jgi:hypothetical protein
LYTPFVVNCTPSEDSNAASAGICTASVFHAPVLSALMGYGFAQLKECHI